MNKLNASQLVEFIDLCDNETGHYFGHYDARNHVVVLRYRGRDRVFYLPRLDAIKTTRHLQSSMVLSTRSE